MLGWSFSGFGPGADIMRLALAPTARTGTNDRYCCRFAQSRIATASAETFVRQAAIAPLPAFLRAAMTAGGAGRQRQSKWAGSTRRCTRTALVTAPFAMGTIRHARPGTVYPGAPHTPSRNPHKRRTSWGLVTVPGFSFTRPIVSRAVALFDQAHE